MEIPKKLIIAGIEWKIELYEMLFSEDGELLYGEEDEVKKVIRIGLNGYNIDNNGIMQKVIRQSNIIVKTLFHELWHIVCNMLSEKDYNNEENACTFATVALPQYLGNCNTAFKFRYEVMCKEALKNMRKEKMTSIDDTTFNRFIYVFSNIMSDGKQECSQP